MVVIILMIVLATRQVQTFACGFQMSAHKKFIPYLQMKSGSDFQKHIAIYSHIIYGNFLRVLDIYKSWYW